MNILSNGYAISETGRKALDDFIYDKDVWMAEQLNIEIINAKTTMVNIWLPQICDDPDIENIPKDKDSQIILIASVSYYSEQGNIPRNVIPEKESPLSYIFCPGGFELDASSSFALKDMWTTPDLWIQFRISDMIAHAKKEFRVQWNSKVMDDPTIPYIPKSDEEYISVVTSKSYYMTKKQRDDQSEANHDNK